MTFKQPHRIWQWFIGACFAGAMLAAAPAQAGVQEIRVLATGIDHDSHRAADLALDYAKKRAVYLLARKMQVLNASAKCAKLTDKQLAQIIRGATVLRTKRVNDVTYADVTVTLVVEPLEEALGVSKAPTIDVDAAGPANSVLVMPVLVGKERAYLWENENTLMSPLRDEVLRQGRGAVMVPAGDFDDRRLIDYQNALNVKPEELMGMFKRYGVDEIVIAIVTPGAEGTLDPTSVLLRRLLPPPKESSTEELKLDPQSSGAKEDERLHQAAVAIASATTDIAGATSQMEQERMAKAPSISVTFQYATAHDLAEMQEAVRNAPGVLALKMPSIVLGQMTGTIYFSGPDRDVVQHAVEQQGFKVRDAGEGWIITLR